MLAVKLWFCAKYLISKANGIKASFQTTYFDKSDPTKNRSFSSCYNCYYKRIDSITYVGIKEWDTANKISGSFCMEKIKNVKVICNLRASTLKWDTIVKRKR